MERDDAERTNGLGAAVVALPSTQLLVRDALLGQRVVGRVHDLLQDQDNKARARASVQSGGERWVIGLDWTDPNDGDDLVWRLVRRLQILGCVSIATRAPHVAYKANTINLVGMRA